MIAGGVFRGCAVGLPRVRCVRPVDSIGILARELLHGYAIARRLLELSDSELSVEEGSLYPAPQKLLLKSGVAAARSGWPRGGRRGAGPAALRFAALHET